jgi:ribosomal-protein-alanine N-acetyltransferase
MTMRISLARGDDATGIAQMSRCLVEAGLPYSWTPTRVRRCVLHKDFAVIVARDGRRMAGFAIMECLDEHAHLCLLAVRPAYRRRGVGRSLVEWLETSARTAGIFSVRLELRAGNEAAKRFYGSLGYRDTGVSRGYYSRIEDALKMEHDLRVVRAPRT